MGYSSNSLVGGEALEKTLQELKVVIDPMRASYVPENELLCFGMVPDVIPEANAEVQESSPVVRSSRPAL